MRQLCFIVSVLLSVSCGGTKMRDLHGATFAGLDKAVVGSDTITLWAIEKIDYRTPWLQPGDKLEKQQ